MNSEIWSWAKCLEDKPNPPKDLDPWKFHGYPGVSFTAKDQCEILLRDRQAFAFVSGPQSSVCDNLHCRTPKRPGFFFAGPALSGTDCGSGKWCDSGTCVTKMNTLTTTTTSRPIWGPWLTSSCKSECIKQSKGFQTKKRRCISSSNSCEGTSSSVQVCEDRIICPRRKSVTEYGTEKCKEFSKFIETIDSHGLQANYDSLQLWMPCAIFCKRKNATSYFTPRVSLKARSLEV